MGSFLPSRGRCQCLYNVIMFSFMSYRVMHVNYDNYQHKCDIKKHRIYKKKISVDQTPKLENRFRICRKIYYYYDIRNVPYMYFMHALLLDVHFDLPRFHQEIRCRRHETRNRSKRERAP